MKQIRLNLGCGLYLAEGFINVDKYIDAKKLKAGFYKNAIIKGEFVQGDICSLPFKDNYADYIETSDAVEHIPFHFIQKAFNEIYRVLKPGGKLCLITTDFDCLARVWTKEIAGKPLQGKTMNKFLDLMEVIYGNQWHDGEFHTVPMNPFFLGILLMGAGFKQKDIDMRVFPMGSRVPDRRFMKATPKLNIKHSVCRTDMIWLKATK